MAANDGWAARERAILTCGDTVLFNGNNCVYAIFRGATEVWTLETYGMDGNRSTSGTRARGLTFKDAVAEISRHSGGMMTRYIIEWYDYDGEPMETSTVRYANVREIADEKAQMSPVVRILEEVGGVRRHKLFTIMAPYNA